MTRPKPPGKLPGELVGADGLADDLMGDDPLEDLVRDSLSRELLSDDPEPEDGWVRFDKDGNLLPKQPPVPSEWDWKQKDSPPGTSLAEHMIGDDPEPEDGWRRFDEQGNLLPRKPLAKPETSGRPAPPPPGLGDISKFISDGSDIRVGDVGADMNRKHEPPGESLADDLIGSTPSRRAAGAGSTRTASSFPRGR
jgi:hypothetical protein